MLLLAADTSGKFGSIALARCETNDACNVLEVALLEGGTFSAQFIPQAAALLQKNGYALKDLGGFAVVSGPGSFTGLRIGLAAIKALAEITQKPIAAVSLLEAVAIAARTKGMVRALLDAGRGDVYVGAYEFDEILDTLPSKIIERLCTRAEFVTEASGIIATPDKSVADFLRTSNIAVQEIPSLRADTIAKIGWEKIQAGNLSWPDDLDANYIRRTDAEIMAKINS
ncbi:MAG TPA: tRNA (adenosine(37)-N6)-threonylcarbamoyltransferase complex dimerization subunit type 1 TsaB [Candidatus Kapabacteria bacterium]|nr:tRNA (adenosine(37)-N6)-threonylcarbamoyltransferase complex dimerization subunit type 1 TsaB [Candidatus Kapabacteria bacterium]